MTGLERLRNYARNNIESPVGECLEGYILHDGQCANGSCRRCRAEVMQDIADQIEREQAEESGAFELELAESRGFESIVDRIADVLGVSIEGLDSQDSGDTIFSELRLRLVSDDDAEVVRWVLEHGGLDVVKEEWRLRSNLKRMFEKSKAKVERQQRHILFIQGKCRERQERIIEMNKMVEALKFNNSNLRALQADIAERLGFTRYGDDYEPDDLLDALDRRLMPPGMEWPRFEDGCPVCVGDVVCIASGSIAVEAIEFSNGKACVKDAADGDWNTSRSFVKPFKRPKQDPVGADGLPIKKGETVRGTGRSQHEFEVLDTHDINPEVGSRFSVKCFDKNDDEVCWCDPKLLTHTKPEPPDSWERLDEDSKEDPFSYCKKVGHHLFTFENAEEFKSSDLVRRAKSLADKED